MLFPESPLLTDAALFLLRVLLAALFGSSGWSHVTKPKERAASIGLPPGLTLLVGLGELAGAAALVLGVFVQMGALLLILIMLGAVQKKVFAWKTGFWGKDGQGWYYELLYIACLLVIVATAGGGWTIL